MVAVAARTPRQASAATSTTGRVSFTAIRLALLLAALLIPPADAAEKRSSTVRAAFVRQNPCPAGAHDKGRCPGYVVDHRVPLACGGPDRIENLQWLTVAEAREKDRIALRECRARRR